MKILVTGAGGFLGGRLVHSLLRSGQRNLRLHARRSFDSTFLNEITRDYPDAAIETAAANLLSPNEVSQAVEGVDLIIHAAAAKRGAVADIYLNTVVGTRNLLDAAVAEKKCPRIALVSSFAMFRSSALAAGAAVDESCPTEPDGVAKGAYGFAKVQQELLFGRYQAAHGFESVVLRPGVIYGPGDSSISTRVGLQVGSLFVSLGGGCLLPLTYVDNCADAIVCAALHAPTGTVYSVVDEELPTCRGYLSLYEKNVRKLTKLYVPPWVFALGARLMTSYNRRSKGQLPAIFTPEIIRSMYRKFSYPNAALKRIGWTQAVPTGAGLERTFAALRESMKRTSRQ
jgi:nucleoside-diphosphate-sugar epimerase